MAFNLKTFNDKINSLRGDVFSYYESPKGTHNFETPEHKIISISIPSSTHLDINNIDLKGDTNSGFGTEIIQVLVDLTRKGRFKTIRTIITNNASEALFSRFGFEKEEGSDDMILYL